ncbi:hypothetical protein RO3G_15280 [Rhizopus delemar RA 99-880]|uniref:Retrotransposon gag domain-containing protein n=1 Tax=Rhizopus delemar (strain RA 99-880 / ATCC MYA-4621 / FGSC 9543 / NRRL 43880) TaxID=246409 RepID=I1CQ39_RHIO9|nr:hypothetical protein RO3G_15280 [Rhizopus delemar RA 99-880]|eukprot:EIE90569.1 hypothetical protein RO3G_15280 [Rhizopus delemar RA 99-880]
MSNPKRNLSQEQKIFEIEERVHKLLTPDLRSKYTLYRKIPTYPKEQRQEFGTKTAEYFDTLATQLANNFTLNSNKQLTFEEDTILEDAEMSNNYNNNINMQDLAQLIASAVATAINNKPEKEQNNVRIPMPSTYNGERNAAVINLWIQEVERYLNFYDVPKTRWISYGVTLLRDRAQKWCNQLLQKNEESTTWEKFKVDLEYSFKPSYSEHAARDRLASIKQNRSVAEYVDEFQDVLLDLPRVSDDEALDRFVRGLKDDARIHVLTKEPRSLEEATRFAIAYDSAKQTGIFVSTNHHDRMPNDPMDLSVLVQQLHAMNIANNNHQPRERVHIQWPTKLSQCFVIFSSRACRTIVIKLLYTLLYIIQ